MSYPLGQGVHLTHEVVDPESGASTTAATVTLTVRHPDASVSTHTPVYDGTRGAYYYDFVPSVAGHYIYRWTSATPDTAAEGDIDVTAAYSGDPAAALWAPALTDVGALVPTRTIDGAGVQQNTFTTTTTPTATQVQGFITGVVGEVAGFVGPVDARLTATANAVAAMGVAAKVELTFPPTGEVVNVATELRLNYQNGLDRLRLANRSIRSGRSGSVALPLEPLKSALPTA